MSLDICLKVVMPASIHDQNYTHNAVPMWSKAGVYDALYMSDGKRAGDFIEVLERGIYKMENDPKGFRKLNPKNGWGSYDTALPWLKEWLAACKENPNAIIWVSK